MKRIVGTMAVVLVSAAVWAQEITVGGKGIVRARPDSVSLTFEVSVLNTDMSAGFEALKEKNRVLSTALSTAGVAENEIKVSNIRMYPQYSYGSASGRNFEGYKQSSTFVITIALDMERVQRIYKAIVGAKAGEDISLNFFIEKDDEYRKEAKRLAVKDAKATAEILAEAAEVQLGKVEEISYQSDGVTPRRSNRLMAKMAFEPEADGMGLATTAVDDIVISESVVVVWQLKD